MSRAALVVSSAVIVFCFLQLAEPGTIINTSIDWKNSHSGPKKYALGVYAKLTWQQAFDYCKDHCMNLASIDSKKEQDYLTKLIKSTKGGFHKEVFWWTGGSQQSHKGIWRWKGEDDREFKYTNWKALNPSLGAWEDCVVLWDVPEQPYSWKNTLCSYPYFFVCEHNGTYPHDYV